MQRLNVHLDRVQRCCEKGDPPTNVYRCTTCYSKLGVAMNKRIPQMTSSTGTKVVDHPAIDALRAIASNSTKKDLDVHRPFVRLVELHGASAQSTRWRQAHHSQLGRRPCVLWPCACARGCWAPLSVRACVPYFSTCLVHVDRHEGAADR